MIIGHSAPAYPRTPTIWDFMSAEMRADALGASVMDHTAAVNAALAASGPGMSFPDGVFNVDGMRLTPAGPKRLYFNNSTFRLRGNGYSPILYQSFPGEPDYGLYDDLNIIGGRFDQNGFLSVHLFRLFYLQRARIEGVTVIHRDQVHLAVTADPDADMLTTGTSSPFVNGDAIALFCNESNGIRPGGLDGGLYIVANVSGDTFTLTRSGNSVDITSSGTGTFFVVHYGGWGFHIGGRDVQLVRPVVQNGTELYQDGVHFAHGDGLSCTGAVVESGDDCFAAGAQNATLVKETSLVNFEFSGTGKSHHGFLVKAHVDHATHSVRNGTWDVSGSAGLLRNGGIRIEDSTGADARTAPRLIEGIEVTATVTVGSAARTQNVNADCLNVRSAEAKVNLAISEDTYAGLRPYNFNLAVVTGTLEVTQVGGSPAGSNINSDTSSLSVT